MLKVGITGGIGGGKSTVSKIIEVFGYPVYNADSRAKYLMNHDDILRQQISELFGSEIYKTGELDRKAMASRVFTDPALLKQVESYVHPAVYRDFENWSREQASDIVFKEAAILFESNGNLTVDRVICVTAPLETRIARVIHRDHLTREDVLNRMKNQWPDKKKIEMSDYVVYADDDHSVIRQVDEILKNLKKT
ncbi:dephospho-CoA kinase [Saccharicrinis sp. FJH62]|uniref:dephospho-CoA kinase n=1 Tax=Saccharicrinis sp. FJH62 TaxID=3344657 RepID=UPI0035D4AACF